MRPPKRSSQTTRPSGARKRRDLEIDDDDEAAVVDETPAVARPKAKTATWGWITAAVLIGSSLAIVGYTVYLIATR